MAKIVIKVITVRKKLSWTSNGTNARIIKKAIMNKKPLECNNVISDCFSDFFSCILFPLFPEYSVGSNYEHNYE